MSQNTLEATAKKYIKNRMQQETKENNQLFQEFLSTAVTYPEIQQAVFEKYFLNQMKTLLNDGIDPYLDEKNEKSISNMWVLTAGSLNTPTVVVSGEGPNKKVLGQLPPFCAPMYLKSGMKKTNVEDNLKDALEHKNSPDQMTYMAKLEESVSKLTQDIKETIKPEEHKKNWLAAIEKIEKNIQAQNPTEKQEEKKRKTPPDEGTTFEW